MYSGDYEPVPVKRQPAPVPQQRSEAPEPAEPAKDTPGNEHEPEDERERRD